MTRCKIISLVFLFVIFGATFSSAGSGFINETDSSGSNIELEYYTLASFFDLRDRETFVQITNADSESLIVHVQIFNVSNNCIENDFFDVYTPNDTHIYNMRDIQTNDGNPSGVVLPSGAMGMVLISAVQGIGQDFASSASMVGNFRVIDNSGYEYRSNSHLVSVAAADGTIFTYNFNSNGGTIFSDIIFMIPAIGVGEFDATDFDDGYSTFDVDIFNLNETPFSCREVATTCIDQDSPRLEEFLEFTGISVGSFEFGLNDVIPSSRGAELLCPGNIIEEGILRLDFTSGSGAFLVNFIGLNNGNGRGSMDSNLTEKID